VSPALAVVCSLGCALTWAFASVTFARVMRGHESVAPQGLNLVKGAIALPFFIVFCVVSGAGLPPIDEHFGWLALSAVLGLLVADTGYFFALKRLGAARGVLFIPLVPVATSLLAAATLGEQLTIWSAVGMALTLVGLVVVLLQPASSSESSAPASSSTMLVGLVGGGIYALSQAAANVATKHVLNGAVVVHVATIRIGVGAVCLFFASWATGALPGLRPLFSKKVFGGVVAAALIGTLGGIWLGTLGAKVLPVGVSTTLAATTPLWALLLSRLSGESVPLRSFVGAVIAVAGVVVLASAQVE
jgi:drug/metabolite transporter (DMT)-like permease